MEKRGKRGSCSANGKERENGGKQFQCTLCDIEATTVKHIRRHWDGKLHQKKMAGDGAAKEPSGDNRQPTSKVVLPQGTLAAVVAKKVKGRGQRVCIRCLAAGHDAADCDGQERKRPKW